MSMQNIKTALLPVTLSTTLSVVATLFAASASATAQDTRPVAFINARIVTISGDPIERGTIVVRDGKIDAVGKDVTVPAGARVVDAAGKTIMPGLVSAWSRAGFRQQTPRSNTPTRGSRRGRPRMESTSNRSSNSAATKVVDGLYARQDIFGELLEEGVTTLALNPDGYGFPGLGAVLDPSGENRAELTLDDDAFVQVGMTHNSTTKKLLKETFDKAKKVVEEREKPKEQPKPEAPKPEAAKPEEGKQPPKPGEKPAEQPKEQPKPGEQPKPQEPKPQEPQPPQGGDKKPEEQKKPPEKPKDPNLEVLADLLQGKRRAIVQIGSASDMLHWLDAVGDELEFPRALAVPSHDTTGGTIDLVLEHVQKWKCPVLLTPRLSTKDRTQYLTNPAKTLHDAGIEIAFDIGDTPVAVRGIFYQLMELVRSGLPADVALQAVTLVPAKMLGIDKRTGSIEAGKHADLLVFDGDPLSPTGRLEQVWLRGRRVER